MIGSLILSIAVLVTSLVGRARQCEECGEETCSAIEKASRKVEDILVSKHGVDAETARTIARKLFSGIREEAEEAVKKIREVGALEDVADVLMGVAT